MYKWNYLPYNANLSLLQNLMHNRGISQADLEMPKIHHPFLLHDAQLAAQRLLQAIEQNKQIFIHGDYDVDGVCATAIVWDYIYRKLNYTKVTPFIPSRFDEGYGLSTDSITQMVNAGATLIISVDCGIKDIQLVQEWQAKGVDFIITDHHTLPTVNEEPIVSSHALAVVHPKHPDGNYPFTDICGAAVAWKFCCAVQEVVSKSSTDINADYHKAESFFEMQDYLDLVSLATVCDVMPLVQENRAFVKLGLKQFSKTNRPGLTYLCKLAGIDLNAISVYHYGYVVGPRLNAAGRLASAMTALKLLTTSSQQNAATLAAQLDALNIQRQELSKQYLLQALTQAREQLQSPISFVYGAQWPEGIVGLVAGRLAEQFYKPAFVASITNGVAVGSARSPNGFHLASGLKHASDLLTKFGGHAQAAGFSLPEANLPKLNLNLINQITQNPQLVTGQKEINIDFSLTPELLNISTWQSIQQLNPFGNLNSEPIFAVNNVTLKSVRKFGKNQEHSGLILQHPQGLTEAVAFNYTCNIPTGSTVNIAGTLNLNSWGGSSKIELGFKDIDLVV